jgi:Arc/MetJ-type ribon-helix-helix transcriptional regulator
MTKNSQIVRKKFCLTDYHEELLEKVVEQRYANRSEAVRVAIEHHTKKIGEGEETKIDSLQADLEGIADEIQALHEKLDEQNSSVVHVSEQVTGVAEGEEQSEASTNIKELIVQELSEESPLSIDELADRTEKDTLSILSNVNSLQDEGLIRSTDGNTDGYKIDKQ